jgi:hypothetical protein
VVCGRRNWCSAEKKKKEKSKKKKKKRFGSFGFVKN